MRRILLLLFITSFATSLFAQKHIVRGKVSDDLGGVLGVTVVEVDANDRIVQGSITDMDGNFTMQVSSPNVTMKFSFIGYKTSVEPVNGRSTIDVMLESDAKLMKEVVIVGEKSSASLTGVNVRDQTGASTVVKMDGVQGSVVSDVGDALQGQVAGLDIMGGGSPGSGSSIVIRGLGSLGGSNPLVVVDGVVQKVSTSDVDFGSADSEDIGMLVSIAPEDIKSVRVLKDAAETAVYGTQGAAGVLEIETNKGTQGKTRFDINYKKSLSFEPPSVPMLDGDEYVMLQQEMYHNRYGVTDLPMEISNDFGHNDYYNYAQNTDWVEEITRVGQIDDFGFKLSGGGEKTSYYASVNYQNNVGTVKNTANKRFTTRINLGYKISTKLSLNTTISYVNIYKDDNWKHPGNNSGKSDDITVRKMAYKKAPNMAIYEYTKDGEETSEFFTPMESYQGDGVRNFNPSAVVALSDYDQENNNFQTNFTLKYNVNRWLTLKEMVSFQFENSKRMGFLPNNAIGADWLNEENNSSMERNATGTLVTTRTMANFTPITNSTHSLSGLLMMETNQNRDEYIETSAGAGPSSSLVDPSAGGLLLTDGVPMRSASSLVNSIGFLAQVHYKLLDQHIFMVNMRSDASSRFGENSRWGTFPSASYAWRFSNASFLQNLSFLDDSKARVSYGISGNSNVGAYDRHGLYSAVSDEKNAYMDILSIVPKQAELTKLKWETSTMLNVGLDLSFFNHRWDITAEYYDKVTRDVMWRNYKLATSSGFNSLSRYNDGSIQNSGYEFGTNITAVKKKDWSLRLNFNIYFNENKFLTFPSNIVDEKTAINNGAYPLKAEIGKPVGSFFGFRYEGVYATTADAVAKNADGSTKLDAYGEPIPMNYNGTYTFQGGDAKYQDVNHDGRIDLDDVVYLGDSNPDFAGGLGFNIKYKRLQFNCQFLYRYGNQIVNGVAIGAESMSNKNNQSTAVLRRWRVDGDDFEGILPRAYLNHPCNNLGSDRYVEDASFLRLNNMSLNYTFGPSVLKPLGLKSLKMGLQARKLMTFTNYTGQDPEVQMKKEDALWFGKDTGTVPPSIITAFNIAVGF